MFSLLNHQDIYLATRHIKHAKSFRFRGYFLNSLITTELFLVYIKYPYFYVLSLKTEISSRMKIFGFKKRQSVLLKRLSYIKKYLIRIFRSKSELGHLLFKINILCLEQNFQFISSKRSVISLRVKFPMLELHPKYELLYVLCQRIQIFHSTGFLYSFSFRLYLLKRRLLIRL